MANTASNNFKMSLTDQIRKVNKIQVKKRFKRNVECLGEARELQRKGMTQEALDKFLEYI